MRATQWEFEQRFWIFGLLFGIAFTFYMVDHVNTVNWLTRDDRAERILILCSAALLFLVALFRTWATAYLKTEVVHDHAQHADALVADGPYRYTRNPLYFGNLFLALGTGLLVSRTGFVFLVAAMWIYGYRLIGREEAMLLETQGDSYRRYLAAVPRFWPSLTPRLPGSGARPRWGQAVAGEAMFWCCAIAMLAFAFTFNLAIYSIIFSAGLLIYVVAVWLIRKTAKAKI